MSDRENNGPNDWEEMQQEVAQEAEDRSDALDAAQEQQTEAGDEPDTTADRDQAEWDAMEDAADEGQTFSN